MVNFDNIFLVILYFILGLPGAVVRFGYLNIVASFKRTGNLNYEKLWSKDGITDIFLHPYNLVIGICLFIVVLIIGF
jgi:hypothetical protein